MANIASSDHQNLAGTDPKPSQISNIQERIKKNLDAAFPKSIVQLEDLSGGCGTAMRLTIASSAFDNIESRLKRSRMVNHALKKEIAELHAFQLTTYDLIQFKALEANKAAEHKKETAEKQ